MTQCKTFTPNDHDNPGKLTAALVACSDDGAQLFAAQGDELWRYTLCEDGDNNTLIKEYSIKAAGNIAAISCSGNAPLITVHGKTGVEIFRLRDRAFETFTQLPTVPRQVLATRANVFILTTAGVGRAPEILRLDARSGMIEHSVTVSAGIDQLRAASGRAVLAVNRRRRKVHRIDLDDVCKPEDPVDPDRPSPLDTNDHGRPCCCTPVPRRDPETGSGRPRRPAPRDYCEDGDDGIEDDCRIYTQYGTSIICRDICDPGRKPCRRNLHSKVESIQLLGNTLFAITRGGRTVEALDARSLSLRSQNALVGRGGITLSAPATARLLSLAPDLSKVIVVQAPTAATQAFDLQANISERTFHGTDGVSQATSPSFAIDNVTVLVIPTVAPSQNYSGESSDIYRDALHTLLEPDTAADAPLNKVQRYYSEQSEDENGSGSGQQLMDFTVWGAETTSWYTGGPVAIENDIGFYYYPAFVAGGMRISHGSGPDPFLAKLRGDSSLDIEVTSSVNANEDNGDANVVPMRLNFPAAIVRLDLDSGRTIAIPRSGTDWSLTYEDSSGTSRSLTLEPSNLPDDIEIPFEDPIDQFEDEANTLRDALQAMLDASTQAADFEAIDVVWGARPDQPKGRLYILLRFAEGGQTPRIVEFGSSSQIENFFNLEIGDTTTYRAWADPTAADLEAESTKLSNYLTIVMWLAEFDLKADRTVCEPLLSKANVTVTQGAGMTSYNITLSMSDVHGMAPAQIAVIGAFGPDPLRLAEAVPFQGSDFSPDAGKTMRDKTEFFKMLYGRMVTQVDNQSGGLSEDGWKSFSDYLQEFSTVYVFPVEPPPPGHPGAWSVAAPGADPSLRAFVDRLDNPTTDPSGIGEPTKPRWGMNFQSFDTVAPPDKPSPLESDTRTFGHELGHTHGLADQYSSKKFDPTLRYLGGLDLMGNSGAEWPHFCAYHKLALGWWDGDAPIVVTRPAEGVVENREFLLVPTEWWRDGLEQRTRDAFNGAGSLTVAPVVICDLGGDGGILSTIEARAPGREFSTDMDSDSTAGQVMILNVLDYGDSRRYGQVIADAGNIPETVIAGLLRFRRRIHLLANDLQPGDGLDFADAPGFPLAGLEVNVTEEASITVDGTTVPVYRCNLAWEGGVAADVGFADNDEEWRSSDIAIDYLGEDPENPDSGENSWPDGEPVDVGENVVVPAPGMSAEPHRVRVRVRNFGTQTANDVAVSLYLREPGGGGEMDGTEPYETRIIPELLPVGDAGPEIVDFTWDVEAGQEQHVCWRAEVGEFRIGEGPAEQIVVNDASITNNWAQQNIFNIEVPFASPPEPLISRFSVFNNGPFIETARLVPQGLPRGVTLRVRPEQMSVPAYSQRVFSLRFEFEEELTRDECSREMEVLLRCLRREDHYEEPWGASLFRIKLKRNTETTVDGTWNGPDLALSGEIEPALSLGRISIKLDFLNGEAARWVSANLSPGGTFDATFNTAGIDHNRRVRVAASYRGTDLFMPSTSDPVDIRQNLPEG